MKVKFTIPNCSWSTKTYYVGPYSQRDFLLNSILVLKYFIENMFKAKSGHFSTVKRLQNRCFNQFPDARIGFIANLKIVKIVFS